MKTSNKILFGALIVALLSAIIFMLVARTNVSEHPNAQNANSDNNTLVKTLAETHDFNTFDLGFNNVYFFDETYEGISVNGPSSAVSAIRVSNELPLRFYYEGYPNASEKKLIVRIGIKNKTGFDITLHGNAKCNTNAADLDAKSISANGNAVIELNVKTESLLLSTEGNGRVYANIEAATVSATANGNGKLKFHDDSQINKLNVSISGNASITGGIADSVSGSISENGKLELDQINNKGGVLTSGNGRDRSNYTE